MSNWHDPASHSLLEVIRNCPECKVMIETYNSGILLIEYDWLKRVWKAHKYRDHRLI